MFVNVLNGAKFLHSPKLYIKAFHQTNSSAVCLAAANYAFEILLILQFLFLKSCEKMAHWSFDFC